jgi:hypothetical protein
MRSIKKLVTNSGVREGKKAIKRSWAKGMRRIVGGKSLVLSL